jgi:hypothetical protein
MVRGGLSPAIKELILVTTLNLNARIPYSETYSRIFNFALFTRYNYFINPDVKIIILQIF